MKNSVHYVVIAHGSRDPEAATAFESFLAALRKKLPDREMHGAFLELLKPTIPEAIDSCIRGGAKEILVMPLMFFPGRHVKNDIPQFIQEAKAKYPAVDFHYSGPLYEHPAMLDLLEAKAADALAKKK